MQYMDGIVIGFEQSVIIPVVVVTKREMDYLINNSKIIVGMDFTAVLPQGIFHTSCNKNNKK